MSSGPTSNSGYRVLARKYRPSSFEQLIGQEALVRTLENAIRRDSLAHAYLLTGVRGVGKTSTARLLAKALNCVGPDGLGGPTIKPCGICEPCQAIAESRHIDVLEMDAASRTGVDDVREIIDAARYAAVSARYKIYIIDEVHMLSRSAFNALLKTLEEPPSHVKFIFATTEVQKLPVTVLSRCQRFDLKRIPVDRLAAHYADVLQAEGATGEEEALQLIARAADGSARDGLSILDQAMTHGGGVVTAAALREMIGLSDRALVRDLLRAILDCRAADALRNLREQYEHGASPEIALRALLDIVHELTRTKLSLGAGPEETVSASEELREQSQGLSFGTLHRLWQMLLKGLAEVEAAPVPIQAAEMAILRIIHAAELPDPLKLLAQLQEKASTEPAGQPAADRSSAGAQPVGDIGLSGRTGSAPPALFRPPQHEREALARHGEMPDNFERLVSMFEERRESLLAKLLHDDVRLARFAPPHVEIFASDVCPPDLAQRVMRCLAEWTGRRWTVSLTHDANTALTLRDAAAEQLEREKQEILADPAVRALLNAFPHAELLGFGAHHGSGQAAPVGVASTDTSGTRHVDRPAGRFPVRQSSESSKEG